MQFHWEKEKALSDFFETMVEKINKKYQNDVSELQKALQEAQPRFWIAMASEKMREIYLTTHAVKMSNPLAGSASDISNVNNIVCVKEYKSDGFVRTGNSHIDIDAVVSACYLPILKFLELKASDGIKIVDHVRNKSDFSKWIFSFTDNPELVESNFSELFSLGGPEVHSTSQHLPQVYFKVDSGYHLLTVLPPSSNLFSLKNRINSLQYGDKEKENRKAMYNGEIGESFLSFRDLTVIGFGGTKPQNISNLNSINGGTAYLLNSEPPKITSTSFVRFPKHDFFHETCRVPPYLWRSFHKMAGSVKYVDGILDWRDSVILNIFDVIIKNVFMLRDCCGGWSNNTSLPLYQKTFIDSDLIGNIGTDSIIEFGEASVKWFIDDYRRELGLDCFEFGIAEEKFIFKLFFKSLREALL